MAPEIWKNLPRSDLPYQLSSTGQVRRNSSTKQDKRGHNQRYAERMLTVQHKPSGAPYVSITQNGKRVKIYLDTYMNELYGKKKKIRRKLKLTWSQVQYIRKVKVAAVILAERFSVSISYIHAIRQGKCRINS